MSNSTLLKRLTEIDILKEGQKEEWFVGRPFYIDYKKANILVSDHWKHKVKEVPQGSFLLAFYYNPFDDEEIEEAVLLRAIQPSKLPTENTVISSMIEYYKDNLKTTGGKKSDLDDFTRYEFSFSGLECHILGTFYKTQNQKGKEIIEFGADIENFYSAHNYKVFKVQGNVLGRIVNQRDSDLIPGNPNEFKIGKVRYSSSKRFQNDISEVKVWISPSDMLGKRTALFGMTRTGKSNTVKKIIEATVKISKRASNSKLTNKAVSDLGLFSHIQDSNNLKPIDKDGAPKFPVGQIIFDINGEYANKNLQDGTAIFEMFEKETIRYSTLEKPDFKVMKVNFYKEIVNGFELMASYFNASNISVGYLDNFLSVDLRKPVDYDGFNSSSTIYDRKIAAYKCCLFKAQYKSNNATVKFKGHAEINGKILKDKILDPSKGISLEDACTWFEWVWEHYNDEGEYFVKKKAKDGKEWADEDLKSLLVMISGFRNPRKKNKVYGYKVLSRREIFSLHSIKTETSFEEDISKLLRGGKIVIVDLSLGNPEVQATFSEKICKKIFNDSMNRFTKAQPNNFIQFYFEEAHNLFPKKEDRDLSQIYNRLAKEGAKLNLGMLYATQEVSSISSNILKNTQNWFIAHLNNEDELKELRKYYDFSDFANSLLKFSARNDKGFVRMKTYSNPFVVPVQIDLFEKTENQSENGI